MNVHLDSIEFLYQHAVVIYPIIRDTIMTEESYNNTVCVCVCVGTIIHLGLDLDTH